ncbi:rhamnogalacturonan acetylesterase [Muricauda sp. CAU 1633]|uniref:rhamnogalacturonan acetylesterase n=1 Tax=Allomuricauda sp. CAU 1633 TaxID=2816036 RepID=UPI001A8E326F|nr:rhamnogalacturonan acetylesterase [Muricauda sp. CAU 1633]MBO0324061.1 rhamnogalacturonan acetylesterase [Muricauda sp. CAU 1633]
MTDFCKHFSVLFLSGFLGVTAQNNPLNKAFFFGKKAENTNAISIRNPITFNGNLGYGFDYESGKDVAFKRDYITSKSSIYFSIQLPEGNYKVNVVLGGKKCANTTIKAESRRLMLQEVESNKEDELHYSFVVNVRSPQINEERAIAIKDRDKGQLNWDDKLTLEFSGIPAIKSIEITPANGIKTIFLAGDSTVTDQDVEPWASWGQFFTNYLNDDIVVANFAESGSSLPAFKNVLRLEKIMTTMKSGDYLFVEFGHNDEKIKGEGNGAWGLYTDLLAEYVDTFRDKGGKVVLLTPTERRHFDSDGNLKHTHGDFPDAMREVASRLKVPLIDLTVMTRSMYENWGVTDSKKALVHYPENTFPGQDKKLEDDTHFNSFGANEIAKCVVQGIKDLDLELVKFLKPNIPTYNPQKPDNFSDWTLPMSTRFEVEKPDGN